MWYPASSVIGVPSVYAVGGSHESVTLSPVICAPEPEDAEELGPLELFEELELMPLGAPAAASAPEQEEPEDVAVGVEPVAVESAAEEAAVAAECVVAEPVVVESVVPDDPCTADGAAVPSAEGELEPSEDDPLPHAVSIPPAINEPATNSVHERTPVLLIGTPRPATPFSNATRTTQSYTSNGFGAFMCRGLPEADGREAAVAF
ncbi:MAG: hypothetical protein ACREUT_13470 [Steroidobacteraceae bacterium]